MLGDVAHSLGELKSRKAIPRLNSLLNHDIEWLRQNAKWALAQISNDA
jgi:HEAT repeat protein